MQKKVVILNAGIGCRMVEIGRHFPKYLLRVSGKSILFHQVDRLVEIGIIGVNDITVVIGHKKESILAEA